MFQVKGQLEKAIGKKLTEYKAIDYIVSPEPIPGIFYSGPQYFTINVNNY